MIPRIAIALLLVGCLALPSAAADGTLRVKSNVSGAEVFLDGTSVGTTPLTVTTTEGVHRLVVVKQGFERHEQDVTVPAGATAKVFVMMKAVRGALPSLPARFYAIHQHSAGTACSGVLEVSAEAIDYRSHDGHDVFHIPISQVRSLSRSMGTAWWTARPLNTAAEYSACRLEVPGRSYGFFAYEEDANLAGTPAENRVTPQQTGEKTQEMCDLIRRLWADEVDRKQTAKPPPM